MADRPVPPAVGVPGGGGGPAPPLARPPEPLVSPGRLLPASRLGRPARQVPRGATLEAAACPAASRAGSNGVPAAGGRGRLLDHVAARRGRPQPSAPAIALRSPASCATSGQGQGR